MAKANGCRDAIARFEEKSGVSAADAKEVKLCWQNPPIDHMDTSLQRLKAVEVLSLSSNMIDRIANVNELRTLRTLSLGRNMLRRIEGIEALSDNLEQLWLSYNEIDKLVPLAGMRALRVLYISNNQISSWRQVEALKSCAALEELMLIGNPIADGAPGYRVEVVKRLPQLKKLDGVPISDAEYEAASA